MIPMGETRWFLYERKYFVLGAHGWWAACGQLWRFPGHENRGRGGGEQLEKTLLEGSEFLDLFAFGFQSWKLNPGACRCQASALPPSYISSPRVCSRREKPRWNSIKLKWPASSCMKLGIYGWLNLGRALISNPSSVLGEMEVTIVLRPLPHVELQALSSLLDSSLRE